MDFQMTEGSVHAMLLDPFHRLPGAVVLQGSQDTPVLVHVTGARPFSPTWLNVS